jgi:hypothetical protein
MIRTAASLCEGDCAIRGRHVPDCAEDECRGCQPRSAADGLRLCVVHTERIAEDAHEASKLYGDLALVLIRRGADGERTSGSAISAPIPDEDVMDARMAIRSTLIRLTGLIVAQRGLSAPVVVLGGRTFLDTSVGTLGPWVARHADWLAAHQDAGRHSRDLHNVTRGPVRAMAYPAGGDKLYVGDCPLVVTDDEEPCGTRLYQRADQALITCPGCGTSDTIEQWQRWMFGDAEGITDAYAIAAHLAVRWLRTVDASVVRQWAHRGHIQAVTDGDGATVRDHRGRTQNRISEVFTYAEVIWGHPIEVCPVSRGRRS